MCWYCAHGWPKVVADIYECYSQNHNGFSDLDYGPGHVVWSDENFDDDSIRACLARCEPDSDDEAALQELLAIPLEIREPAAYLAYEASPYESDVMDFKPAPELECVRI